MRRLDKVLQLIKPPLQTVFFQGLNPFLRILNRTLVKHKLQHFLAGNQPANARQYLLCMLWYSLSLLPPSFFSNPSRVSQTFGPPFQILSGSKGALGAKKKKRKKGSNITSGLTKREPIHHRLLISFHHKSLPTVWYLGTPQRKVFFTTHVGSFCKLYLHTRNCNCWHGLEKND